MKTTIATVLMTLSLPLLANETKIEIPKALKERHALACPEVTTERGEWMQNSVYDLPSMSGVKSINKLYVLGCEMYAYNSLERAYIVNSYGDITDVAVTEVDSEGNFGATTNLMGAGYDEGSQTLGTFSKGRGIGDCGASALYKYSVDSERFVLVEQRLKLECDMDVEAEWPIVFPKK